MNTTHLRQRLFLWTIVHLGIRDCSPRQLLRFWLLLGSAVVFFEIFAVFGMIRGDELAWLLVLLLALVLAVGVVVGGMAAADLRSPVTVEGRVTGFKRLWIKGADVRNSKRWQYRVTLDDGTGNERIYRAADETSLRLSEGDVVRANVGPRLRWIFDIEVLGHESA